MQQNYLYRPYKDGHVVESGRPIFYIIQNLITLKYYAGYKSNKKPFMLNGGYITSSKIVKDIIRNEGISAFRIMKIRYFATGKEAQCYEERFLKKVDARDNDRFYNLCNGGKFTNLGRKHSRETLNKLALVLKHSNTNGRNWWNNGESEMIQFNSPGPEWISGRLKTNIDSSLYPNWGMSGKTHSEETKNKMIASSKSGIPRDEKTKEKIRLAMIGIRWWTNGNKITQSKECPGPEWILGRTLKKH